ncbi:MAG TPA: type I-E CRISPR-associated protein Cse1/CasA [Corynebacteriales bacterium]|jgi:CRISPR system Cascade subunit CasA|nr:type I-E CRISPR-associated protein Cse1/CasA [Mycobacteriales bacterium]
MMESQPKREWNLLTEPVLRVVTNQGKRRMNLPELMSALGRDEIHHYEGIQRHQEDAFHVFLSYLSGAILVRCNLTDPVQNEEFWRQGMRGLTQGIGDDAWCLVVNDLTRPAFMQPPLPLEDHEKLKPMENDRTIAQAVDAMDVLVTSKNHDVKKAKAVLPELDSWFYTLISMQTMSGYFGRGRYGISRMNSGYGNRPIVELIQNPRPGARWHDAVVRLIDYRKAVLADAYGFDPQGLVLVWLEMWDGSASLPLSRLDPFYIEICRRVRLRKDEDGIYATDMLSESTRIAARELKGVVGDAWMPVDLESRKSSEARALTLSPEGLIPRILRRIIFEDRMQLTTLHKPLPGWQERTLWMTISVLVRGEGETEGFHEQRIAIPPRIQPYLFGPPQKKEPLAELSRTAIEYAGSMESRVLKPAVFAFLQGGGEKIDYDRVTVNAWWSRLSKRFNAQWSDEYFPWLWSIPEPIDQDVALRDWTVRLQEFALEILRQAKDTMPQHSGRRFRSRSRAELAFRGLLYRTFPLLKEVEYAKSTPR